MFARHLLEEWPPTLGLTQTPTQREWRWGGERSAAESLQEHTRFSLLTDLVNQNQTQGKEHASLEKSPQ